MVFGSNAGYLAKAKEKGKAARALRVLHQRRSFIPTAVEDSLLRQGARYIVFSPVVSYGISLLILLHVILLGPSDAACFVVEMALKLLALGCRNFWLGEDRSGPQKLAAQPGFQTLWPSLSTSQLRLLRFARFARALRSIRVAKLFRHVRALSSSAWDIGLVHHEHDELTLLDFGTFGDPILYLWSDAYTVSWFSLANSLGHVVILFSGATTRATRVLEDRLVVEHCRFLGQDRTGTGDPMAHCPESLKKYWASVPESMLTLFMAMSQGINWVEAMEPLREVHWGAVVLILVYIVPPGWKPESEQVKGVGRSQKRNI
ncbi:Voltage-dependent L-type calcium channel subunit alpha-1C [Durusdinium trenchii]|uniref:Voltage-dependent L-type calcium channel subunit alpha-1C n=1 Tax=Durusdinium trenchii TaxID=1381693 RepID=A0ABP0RQQ9_9DINO